MENSCQLNSTIHNIRLDSHFTITANSTPEDANLSWAAKGLLWYILSRPHDWSIHTWQLSKIYTGEKKGNKKDAIQEILRELRDAGYIKYTKERNAEGKWVHRYDVYPMRISDFQKKIPERDHPALVNPAIIPSTELPSTELPPPLSSPPEKQKKQLPNQQVVSLRSDEEEIFIDEVLNKTKLSPKEKVRLKASYATDKLIKAIEISKTQPVKKSLMGLLLNILENPDKWEVKNETEHLTENQQIALQYNYKLSRIDPKLSKTNENLIKNNTIKILLHGGIVQLSLKAYDFLNDIKQASKELDVK